MNGFIVKKNSEFYKNLNNCSQPEILNLIPCMLCSEIRAIREQKTGKKHDFNVSPKKLCFQIMVCFFRLSCDFDF